MSDTRSENVRYEGHDYGVTWHSISKEVYGCWGEPGSALGKPTCRRRWTPRFPGLTTTLANRGGQR
jgi:hypothetical protein